MMACDLIFVVTIHAIELALFLFKHIRQKNNKTVQIILLVKMCPEDYFYHSRHTHTHKKFKEFMSVYLFVPLQNRI